MVLVDLPKVHDKHIIRLEANEVADLLDQIESGDKLTEKEKAYHRKPRNVMSPWSLYCWAPVSVSANALVLTSRISISPRMGYALSAKAETRSSFTSVTKFAVPCSITLSCVKSAFQDQVMRKHCFSPCRTNGSAFEASKIW